jgi:tRNA A-37 threonylcarbamoyl transferase component Bud32
MKPEPTAVEYTTGDDIDGRYELRRDVGTGGAGRVFEAVHRFTGRTVALKIVMPNAPPAVREELRARLMREARALAHSRHPNIVEVLDGGVLKDGAPFLVMEMLEGRTLEGLLAARGRLAVEDTLGLALQLCDGLEAAHAAGVVHRDVKPSNILVVHDHAKREVIKLVDFGIAHMKAPDGDKLTGIGALIGTPAYMSPEQLLALEDVDAQSDVYSLGVTLFECLTGEVPYVGSYQRVLLQVCSNAPVPTLASRRPDIPSDLSGVVDRAMARSRKDRYSDIKELRVALQRSMPGSHRDTHFFNGRPAVALKAPAARPAEQRRLVRVPYATPIQLALGGVVIDARTEDISTGGALVICRQTCPVNVLGTIKFASPIEGKIVSIGAVVRWVRAARSEDPEGPRAVGLEFQDAPAPVVASIARYVDLMTRPPTEQQA